MKTEMRLQSLELGNPNQFLVVIRVANLRRVANPKRGRPANPRKGVVNISIIIQIKRN
jgi:hypothetical protein